MWSPPRWGRGWPRWRTFEAWPCDLGAPRFRRRGANAGRARFVRGLVLLFTSRQSNHKTPSRPPCGAGGLVLPFTHGQLIHKTPLWHAAPARGNLVCAKSQFISPPPVYGEDYPNRGEL